MDAINKAFQILDVFLETEGELSITDLAKLAHMNPSTAHRITSTLVKRGYIEQAHKRGNYFISTRKLIYFTGMMEKRLKIRKVALPFLQELSQTVDEAVELSLRLGQLAFNVEVINRERLLNVRAEYNTFGLYSTGVGKVFLAYMSEMELQKYLDETPLVMRTPNTITNVEDLRSHLKKVKQDEIAFDDEEHELGVRTVAAPVRDWRGNIIASVSIIGTSIRISKLRMMELAPLLKANALTISQAMGYALSANS